MRAPFASGQQSRGAGRDRPRPLFRVKLPRVFPSPAIRFPADYRRLLERNSRVIRRDAGERSRGPFFSVITVTLNRAAGLERAIRSLQAQNERDVEHVVIDGGSSDATVALLQDARAGVDVWVSERDAGIADALNKGIALASGEWIVLLHADDELAPGALRHWKQMARSGDDADVLSCAIRFVDANGQPGREVLPEPGRMARGMSMPHPGMAVKRSLYERIGLFRTDFRVAMDYEFTLRAQKLGARIRCDTAVVVLMQMGGASDRQLIRSRNENLRARIRWLGLRPWMLVHYAREMAPLALASLRRSIRLRRPPEQ
jgi:glycosyltransferase involved in cell wall biosynthesis